MLLLVYTISCTLLARIYLPFWAPLLERYAMDGSSGHLICRGGRDTVPDQEQVLRILQDTLATHTTLLFMYKTFWDIYSFTAFPRRKGIMRMARHNYDKLRVIATCPHCRDLLTHPSIIEIGASPSLPRGWFAWHLEGYVYDMVLYDLSTIDRPPACNFADDTPGI